MIDGKGKPLLISILALILCFSEWVWNSDSLWGQNISISEETKAVRTYPYSDPNPVPAMAVNSTVSPFYPWFVFDGYSRQGIDADWKVVTLENDYIRLSVLPGVGGKVWGATEKSTGREFIYLNHVLKFRGIGIRGPWTSGGIEHNFGLDLGHAPWTSSAVDYILKTNPDGSATCVVGGLDLASRTQWRVSIILPKDKAYFMTRSLWYNPTPLHDAYLSWENAGFKATGDLQFYFPGTFYIGHDGAVSPWPVDAKGRNLSLYRNNNFGTSKSYHVSGLLTGWFGGYWHDAEFGFGHYSPYTDAPGKKIWIWSLARDGAIWEDLLTDSDGQYIEAQSGVKFNQANRESGFNSPYNQLSMRPYYSETKDEYWFPVKETRGMVDASPSGTLNVMTFGDSLQISICAGSAMHDSLKVSNAGKTFYTAFINLNPMQVFKKAIHLPSNNPGSVRVTVGNNLLTYAPVEEYKTGRPVKSITDQDFNSAEHLFQMGEDENAMRNYDEALEYYLACLQKEPSHSRALSKVAEIYFRMAEYSKALEYSRRVLENDTYDAGANFISGVIQRRLGNLIQAEEYFSIASRTMEYRSASYLEIAGIKMLGHEFENALICLNKSLYFNRLNIQAYELQITAFRKLNKFPESLNSANSLLEIDPLNHYARFEQYLLDPDPANLQNFKSGIRNELPYETYLELAIEYVNQGFTDEAVRVLEQSPPYPTVFYWLAYLDRLSSPEKSSQYLNRAEEMPSFLVFPFRPETIPVLSWAKDQHDSWKTGYYLGLIYWHIHRIDKARELFEQCGDVPDYAPFYLARAALFQDIETDNCIPCSDLDRAVSIDPGEWRTWHYRSNFLLSKRSFELQLTNSKKAFDRFPLNPVIGTDYAKALLNSGNFRECVRVLEKVNILPQEGAHEGHDIFETANLGLAVESMEQKKYRAAIAYLYKSLDWPENLGAGKPYEPDTRFQNYALSFCYSRTGNPRMADSCIRQIVNYSAEHWGNDAEPANAYIAIRVFHDLGRQKEVIRSMNEWKTEQDSLFNWKISNGSATPQMQWVLAKYNNDETKSAEFENEILRNGTGNRFSQFIKAMAIIKNNKNEK